ncbi:MAG TPA: DUF2382 domain-containing protein [Acidobacteriaceae bacterium]|jgi:uncharacterized protein (TIGR02271 family)|nr:DUF2382 domain-containing protein [Acidobacteriaceae bacterium]
MSRNETVAGYFSSKSQAESAISALKDAGFSRDKIGLAIKGRDYETTEQNRRAAGERHESGRWGRVKEFFGGEQYDEPSYRSEDMDTALSGLSINDEQARYLRHRFDSTDEGAIVTVSADGREDEARQILERSGCDIGRSASTYDYSQAETTAGRDLEEQNVQLYGEVLRVHTDRVSRGEARLRKEVHTDTQTVEVPVKREELVVERVPVSGERPAESASFQEKEIRIPLSEEQARVEKQPVVREEVRVGKKEVPDTETFKEEVRSEDLKVEEDPSKRTGRKAA